jgi:predicted patatin/cPLA2 family phospholipase
MPLDFPNQTALVCEGGGIKGAYVSGVLKVLLEEYSFRNVDLYVGTSSAIPHLAYACAGKEVLLDNHKEIWEDRVIGEALAPATGFLHWIWKTKGLVDTEGLVSIFRDGRNALDTSLLEKSDSCVAIPVTNIRTSQTEYFTTKKVMNKTSNKCHYLGDNIDSVRFFKALKASMSPPYISRAVNIGNELYADGGYSCPVPVKFAIDYGCKNIIIIPTKPIGYKRQNYLSNNFDNYFGKLISSVGRLFCPKYRDIFYKWNDRDKKCREHFNGQINNDVRIEVIYPSESLKHHVFPVNISNILGLYETGLITAREALGGLFKGGSCNARTTATSAHF